MKPSWDDAPEWASFVAKDENGTWYFYESRPKWLKQNSSWASAEGRVKKWSEEDTGNGTLEKRP